MFKEYTTSDENLRSTDEVLDMMKTFLGAHDAVLNEVQFPATLGQTYVTAGNEAIKEAVSEFLGESGEPEPAEDEQSGDGGDPGGGKAGRRSEAGQGRGRRRGARRPGGGRGRERSDGAVRESDLEGEDPRRRPDGPLPDLLPDRCSRRARPSRATRARSRSTGRRSTTATSSWSRSRARGTGLITEYYGVSGTNWNDPPILENPSETRTIDGRDYMLFYDGDRLRLVGWKQDSEAYWVTNTLLQTLDDGQMLEIAKSMRKRVD